jgi:hypothetical protein
LGSNVSEPNSVGSRPNCRCVENFSGEFCNSPVVKLNDTTSWIQVPYKYNGEWYQNANFILEVRKPPWSLLIRLFALDR